jgi:hypothetical protein
MAKRIAETAVLFDIDAPIEEIMDCAVQGRVFTPFFL